jgi:predicted CoA-binding protein
MSKKTVIVGATPNPSRYAFLAADRLRQYGHEFVPLGIRKGMMGGKDILDIREKPMIDDVDTLTLYIGPQRQADWIDYLLSLKPKRIIFNPGTENVEFERKAEDQGIETVEGCTLVMLRSSQY